MSHQLQTRRVGAINVLVAFLLVGMLAMTTIAVDVGYLLDAREEMQRTCDAAALAACWELAARTADGESDSDARQQAVAAAAAYAGLNDVTNEGPSLAPNAANSLDGDVVFGYISDASNPDGFTTNTTSHNAVRVRVRRTDEINGTVPFFLGGIFGKSGQDTEASATAMLVNSVRGFRARSDGENLGMLPFTLDKQTWDAYQAGAFADDWAYDKSTKTVSPGSDGRAEFNLYPQGTGSPGNRGTVDVGSSNNSTDDIARQILHGVSEQDLQDLGKPLELDQFGALELNGDTGISAGIKDELTSIIGKPRVIPVFASVSGPGNNAQFTIVKWVGIRVMEVKLTGNKNGKRVMIQEAPLITRGVVPGASSSSSESVYSPVFVVQ